jgi:hypothetical protein
MTAMTSASVTPINGFAQPVGGRADQLADLVSTLADLVVKTHNQREDLQRFAAAAGDTRVEQALAHLSELERHAQQIAAEAAGVRLELQHARLI